ncbi:MAG: hypothetical protein HY719_02200, partial [Planctomycetes bacterium]|nr:hypothetical protein [Planctomycetota bacterium]
MASDADILFGKIAIKRGFCSKEQVRHCLQEMENEGDRPLGAILVAKGFLTAQQEAAIASVCARKLGEPPREPKSPAAAPLSADQGLFGRLLIERGYV